MTEQEKLDAAFEQGIRYGKWIARREADAEARQRYSMEAKYWQERHDELLRRVADLTIFNIPTRVIVLSSGDSL